MIEHKPYEKSVVGHWEGGQVLLGDSTKLIDELPENSVDLVFCDPPYGNENRGGEDFISRISEYLGKGKMTEGDVRTIMNDGKEAHDMFSLMLPKYQRVLHPGGVLCICGPGGGGTNPIFANWAIDIDHQEGLEYKFLVIWDKGVVGVGWHFRRCYETVHVAFKPTKTGACTWHQKQMKEYGINQFSGIQRVQYAPPAKDEHPTPKPVKLIEPFIATFSRPRGIVLDTFAGGGSTGVAAVNMGRRFLGFELDPHWQQYANQCIEAAISGIDRKSHESGQIGLFS